MIKKIAAIEFDGLITFPCVSSNLANSDWEILDGLVRSPRKYYQLVLLSDEPIFIGDIVLKNDNVALQAVHGEVHSKIIATYPKIQNLPTFSLKFLEEWIANPVKTVDVAYNQIFGSDFHKSTLIVLNDQVTCKIVDTELDNLLAKKFIKPDVSLDQAAKIYTEENLLGIISETIYNKISAAYIAGSLASTTGDYWFEKFKQNK